MFWNSIVRPALFRLPAERAHYLSMGTFEWLAGSRIVGRQMRRRYQVSDPALHTRLGGLEFLNPIGLAAGFDKDARWFPQLANLGFSHVEVGTLTGQPQPGNPQPRLFRLPQDRAILNRMGFNNQGCDAAARRLERTVRSAPEDVLGINIGKTKVVPVEEATADYLYSFERLFSYADYFTINVSSPNTPGLRTLQNREPLLDLLGQILELNQRLAADHEVAPKPVLLKIAPDLNEPQLEDIVAIAGQIPIAGIIATNTTLSREGLQTPAAQVQALGDGGISGAPLTGRSRQIVAWLHQRLGSRTPLIGVGGVMTGEDAWQMILAGATLVQIYTGFIYGGPTTVRDMNRHLLKRLAERGWTSVSQAVGQGAAEMADLRP